MEQTYLMIKPEIVADSRQRIGAILKMVNDSGFRILQMQTRRLDRATAERFYAEHRGKEFFGPLVDYITSGPVVVMVWEAHDAIGIIRNTMGSTRPAEAAPGTIRGDWGLEVGRNIVHGSDGPETAAFEIDLFFDPGELVSWHRSVDRWIFE